MTFLKYFWWKVCKLQLKIRQLSNSEVHKCVHAKMNCVYQDIMCKCMHFSNTKASMGDLPMQIYMYEMQFSGAFLIL